MRALGSRIGARLLGGGTQGVKQAIHIYRLGQKVMGAAAQSLDGGFDVVLGRENDKGYTRVGNVHRTIADDYIEWNLAAHLRGKDLVIDSFG